MSEIRSTDDLIQAIFDAADEPDFDAKARDRKLSDAIDEAMSHAFGEGYAQCRGDMREQELEKAMRALNETGQGEHGLTHEGSTVRAIENIWGLPPRSKHAA